MANKKYSVVIGEVNGRFSEVFSKLATLHAKNSFSFAIVVGNLFADEGTASDAENEELSKLLSGDIEVPLEMYFYSGNRSLPTTVIERLESSDDQLVPNLAFLGRSRSIKTAEGFRIVTLGGSHAASLDNPIDQYQSTYSDDDVQVLLKKGEEADLLITSDWPVDIRDGSKAKYGGKSPEGIQSIADLCTALKPRYHFSATPAFYERDPFFHPGDAPHSVTRFISLAPFGNPKKQKWIYAFSLEPAAPATGTLPEGCTASPFTSTKKRRLESQEDSYSNFRYSNGNRNDHWQPDRGGRKRHKRHQPPNPDQCFFCLSNEACETHMIASIGEHSYLAVAKGPLSTAKTFPSIGFPCHMLIVPLEHSPTIASISDTQTRQSTLAELKRYQSAMHNMLAKRSRGEDGQARLGAVTWEISRPGGVHIHWQFLPVPVDMVQRGLIEAGFDVEAENRDYPKFVKSAKEIAEAEKGDYFKVMIWSESMRKDMVLPLDGGIRFYLQFGRTVLAKLLIVEDRTQWKDCVQETAEEEADVNAFKEAFKEFDFSLQE